MRQLSFPFVLAVAVVMALHCPSKASAEDWRVWRGPTLDNHAPASATDTVPVSWSKTENVLWRSPVPGKGHASPIVVDGGIFLLTHQAEEQAISLLRYNLSDGKFSGQVVLHKGVVPPKYLHKKNTCASGTPSSDGKVIYTVAQVGQSIQASAVTTQGKVLWQKEVAPYRAGKGWFGYGSSVLLLEDAVVIAVEMDNNDRGLFALDKKTGKRRWKADRPNVTSYSAPILANVHGKPQIVMSGGYQVASYDPKSGRELWAVEATSQTTCATLVWNDTMVFASGSYPDPGTFGIQVTPRGASVAWENKAKCYEQSMLLVGDYLYGVADNGLAYCWRSKDGKEMWKQRLKGPISASPLLVGDRIYATNERGTTYVYRASPNGFERLSENQLGDSSFASPAYADGKLILRHATNGANDRQEFLVAIGK